MKKRAVFPIFLFCLLVSYKTISATIVINYEGIYTPDIYDQSSLISKVAKETPGKFPTEKEMIDELSTRKKEVLSRNLATAYDKKLKLLDERIREEQELESINQTRQNMNIGIPLWGIRFSLAPLYDLCLILSNTCKGEYTKAIYSRNNLGRLEAEKESIKGDKESKLHGLDEEMVSPYEKRYIVSKSKYVSNMQRTIERALIKARSKSVPFVDIYEFLDQALNIPSRSKPLLTVGADTYDTQISDIIRRFNANPFFSKYDPRVQSGLREIAAQLMFDSIATRGSRKGIYYLWGNPGVGKSEASKRICKFFNLPYSVFSIQTERDLESRSVSGVAWDCHGANPGWFIKPILATVLEDGCRKTYKNSVLIINDFDRLFLGRGAATNPVARAAFAFLLDYLDPEKHTFDSSYFKSGIDISYLNIIITGNKPLPMGDDDPDHTYSALRDRMTEIEFHPFSSENKTKILKDFMGNLEEKYGIELDSDQISSLIERAIERTESDSIRKLKKVLERLVRAEEFNSVVPGSIDYH